MALLHAGDIDSASREPQCTRSTRSTLCGDEERKDTAEWVHSFETTSSNKISVSSEHLAESESAASDSAVLHSSMTTAEASSDGDNGVDQGDCCVVIH